MKKGTTDDAYFKSFFPFPGEEKQQKARSGTLFVCRQKATVLLCHLNRDCQWTKLLPIGFFNSLFRQREHPIKTSDTTIKSGDE